MTESIWFTDSLMKVHITPEDTGGAYALIEGLAPAGHMPPWHIHDNDAESFFVLEGEIVLYTPDGEQVLLPGQGAHVPAGVAHTFRVTSTGPTRMISVVAPTGFVEFLRAAGRPAERETLPLLDGPPDLELLSRLSARHGITMVEPGHLATLPLETVGRA